MDFAIKLIELGMKNQIKGLENIHETLTDLSFVVYECGKDLTLSEFEKFSDFERISVLLEDSTIENVISNIRVLFQF